MEGEEVVVNGGISNGHGVASFGNGVEKVCSENGLVRVDVGEKVEGNLAEEVLEVCSENGSVRVDGDKVEGNLAEEVLEDLEEYWEDINDRLMISRMVSDSVIKGMVSAVEQDAAEKIAAKELEVANLKECLRSREVGTFNGEDAMLPVVEKAYGIGKNGNTSCSTDAYKKHETVREDLNSLRNSSREQFEKVKKEIELARGSNSLKKIGSSSEFMGLGGILHEKPSESWTHVNKMLDNLKKTVDAVCTKVDDILLPSNILSCESQQDQNLLGTLGDLVMETVPRSVREEFEENLLEQNAQFCGIQNMNWLEKFNDISSLGTKLDAILKSLSVPETELVSHGSHDLDHLHHKAYGENGTVDESNIHVAESYDFQQLKHMDGEDLVSYFSNIITKIKRDHESALHQKTEEYFRLKREYLKERGSFTTHRKEEEFDVVRKKIPEVISKLENFLLENERFPALTNSIESMGKLKHRLQSLLSENRDLRNCLSDMENEVKSLKAQVSGAAAELLQHSLAEENMLKLDLKSAVKDSCIEASLNEEVFKSALREQIAQIRCDSEDSNVEYLITRDIYDIIPKEAAIPADTTIRHGTEDSDIESLIMQGLDGLVFKEAIRDAGLQLDNMRRKVLVDEEIRISLKEKVLEKENELRLEVEEKEKLKQEILGLRTEMKQRENLALDLSEREQFELASLELIILREYLSQQQALVSEGNKVIESLRSQHLKALEQIEVHEIEMHKRNQELDQRKVLLTEANTEREKAFILAREMQNKLRLIDAKEQSLKREMKMAAKGFSKVCDDFECRVSEAIKRNSTRLEDTSSHLKALTETANLLRRTGLMYRQKLERKFTDLQMAESEVDLLGDEVDTLLRLLEKIYIALDHYSPVLKHYPGIIEILELVRREVTGESTKRP